MELSYSELSKRDVINLADGRCLGRIIDIKLNFPEGVLTGIFVPARKNKGLFWMFDKTRLFIDVDKIVKIGGDVILVDFRCGDNCLPSVKVGKGSSRPPRPPRPPHPPACPPNPCPPNPCPPNCCPPKSQQKPYLQGEEGEVDLSGLSFSDGRIDFDDY